MKIIKKPEIDQSKHYTRIKREVENLKGLRHSNIIQLHDVFQTKRFICIVMEYAPAGDLFELIRSQVRFLYFILYLIFYFILFSFILFFILFLFCFILF